MNNAVKYLGGIVHFPEKADGILTFRERQLEFKSKKYTFNIPLESVIGVKTRKETNKTAMVGSYVALGVLGAFLMRKNKIGILTVTFKDATNNIQNPEFAFIPKTIKDVNLIDDVANKLYELRLKKQTEV